MYHIHLTFIRSKIIGNYTCNTDGLPDLSYYKPSPCSIKIDRQSVSTDDKADRGKNLFKALGYAVWSAF